MNRFFKKNILLIIDFLCLLCMFLFLVNRLKYAIVVNDDMNEILTQEFYVNHGRYIPVIISQFFIKFLPNLFNIHVQNFAFFSEGITKALIFSLLIFVTGRLFNNSNYIKFNTPIYILSYFVIFSILKKTNFIWCFDTFEWFNEYITSLIFYLILWKKLFDCYINETLIFKRDILFLVIFAICNTTGNEELNIAFFILLIFLLLENIYKTKNIKKIPGYILIPVITVIFTSIIVFSSPGLKREWNGYNIEISFGLTKDLIFRFLNLFIDKIFFENILLWLLLLLFSLIIIFSKRGNENNLKVLKYVCYSISGFLIFLLSTIFLPENCIFNFGEYRFWFLHKGLSTSFIILLFEFIIFLSGYIFKNISNKKLKIINIAILLTFCFTHIFLYFGRIGFMPAVKEIKRSLYRDDKISVFYLQKGQSVILPKDQFFYILFDTAPKDLASNKEIYSKIYDKERARYLIYIEKNYNVNVSSGGGYYV